MDISVIIPAYNNEHTIGLVLDALKNQQYDHGQIEVMVIDDCSKDNTIKECRSKGIGVIQNEQNSGLGYTLNKGIKLAKNEIIVTLHADTIPLSADWLSELVKPLADSSIAASCSIEKNRDDEDLDLWEKLLLIGLGESSAFTDKSDAYRKDVLTEIGFFDEKTFRTAGEDEDMALRLRLSNKKLAGSSARVFHNHVYPQSSNNHLVSILKKEYIFGQAGGALRRKFPSYKPGAYVYLTPKSFLYDGLFRVIICVGSLIPYVQLVFIPALILVCFRGISKIAKKTGGVKIYFLYPLFNFLRYWSFTFGYFKGLLTKKQR